MWTLFEYRYRDAANFKAYGQVALEGTVNSVEEQCIKAKFVGQELFIAEQIGIPPLYEELYRWSGGQTDADHCWHEFVQFTHVKAPAQPIDASRQWTAKAFVEMLLKVEGWNESLSPHFRQCLSFKTSVPRLS